MAPKKQVIGLQRVGGEWVWYALKFETLPPDWAETEAKEFALPWQGATPNLHALRRMAIQADPGAVKLLLSLRGQDWQKEAELLARAQGQNAAAQRATMAARSALAYLATHERDN
jgi:hypothetical protein